MIQVGKMEMAVRTPQSSSRTARAAAMYDLYDSTHHGTIPAIPPGVGCC